MRDLEIEELCEKYLEEIGEFRRLVTLLLYEYLQCSSIHTYAVNHIDLEVSLLKLHYEILETREEMRKRLR